MSLIETNIKEEIEIFQRDDSFDVMKGVGIILMIWVHCKTAGIGHFAYTFHMPLFFFISGYFFKLRNLKQEMFIDLQRLFVPYLFTCFVMVLLAFSVFDKFSYGIIIRFLLAFCQNMYFFIMYGQYDVFIIFFKYLRDIIQIPINAN